MMLLVQMGPTPPEPTVPGALSALAFLGLVLGAYLWIQYARKLLHGWFGPPVEQTVDPSYREHMEKLADSLVR